MYEERCQQPEAVMSITEIERRLDAEDSQIGKAALAIVSAHFKPGSHLQGSALRETIDQLEIVDTTIPRRAIAQAVFGLVEDDRLFID